MKKYKLSDHQKVLSTPHTSTSSMWKSQFKESLSVFPKVFVGAEHPFSKFLFINIPYFKPIPIPKPWSLSRYTKKSFLVVHWYTYGSLESPLNVKINIQPRPVLPNSILSTKKAPIILPLYYLIKKIAGSTFFTLLINVVKALPSLRAEKVLCQLYNLYKSGNFLAKFQK